MAPWATGIPNFSCSRPTFDTMCPGTQLWHGGQAGTPFTSASGGNVSKVVGFIGATLGGAAGWWVGARVGTMTAFFLSVLGTAAGVYGARRWLQDYLP